VPRLKFIFFIILAIACSQAPLLARTNRYETIDRHALSTPRLAEQSVQVLARYLVLPARNDEEKARAIFRWIAKNITYDTRSYFTGSIRETGPDRVLRDRTAVCGGFSGLFKSLGREAGIEIENISGYAKGFDYRIGKHFRGPANHAWNAVKLDGVWRLLDATWGAGHLDEAGRFVREFDEHFFLTPPEQMVYTHLPEDPRWQLLDPQITQEAFEKLAYLKPAFFRCGLELESHQDGFIETENSVTVTVVSPEATVLSAQIIRGNRIWDETLTFIQRESDKQLIYASFPSPGSYVLRLFAKAKNEPGMYEWALDYLVHSTAQPAHPPGYPEMYQAFSEKDCFLIRPMEGRLKAGRLHSFCVRIPDAEHAVLIVGNQWNELQKDGELFQGEVETAKGNVQVAAKFPGDSKYDVLLKYVGY